MAFKSLADMTFFMKEEPAHHELKATVPFMLRPVEPSSKPKPLPERRHFQLVDGCYLRGFMHGEMLDARRQILERMTEIAII
jgi:hypothetical protein